MSVRDMIPWKQDGGGELAGPFEELRGVAGSLDRVFDDFWAPIGLGGSGDGLLEGLGGWSPDVEVQETAKEVLVSAALPGVHKKDIHVDLTEDRLTIRAERTHETEHTDKDGQARRERRYGSICRSFTLPAPVKADLARASYKDGVLRLELPKVKETQIRRIEVG